MQEPYHIKTSLQDHYKNFDIRSRPDFSKKCLICGGVDCASYHGYYTRTVISPWSGFAVTDFPILRFKCNRKGKNIKSDHITFSLLPIELVPFRQLELKFMILAVWIRLSRYLSLTNALNVIEMELNDLDDIAEFINISTLMSWGRLVQAAFELFISSGINLSCKSQYEKVTTHEARLLLFLETLIKYESTNISIRGPDAFSWDFYRQSGGAERLAFFLFGKASQHRN